MCLNSGGVLSFNSFKIFFPQKNHGSKIHSSGRRRALPVHCGVSVSDVIFLFSRTSSSLLIYF